MHSRVILLWWIFSTLLPSSLRASTFCHESIVSDGGFENFPDVECWSDFYNGIEYVKHEGIVTGYPDGTYHPSQTINRAEFTKIVAGALLDAAGEDCLAELGAPFPDVPATAWFAPFICLAKQEGTVSGYPDGTFRPEATISLVEAAKIIVNASGGPLGNENADEEWFVPFTDALAMEHAMPIWITRFDAEITRGDMAEIVYRIRAPRTDKPSHTTADIRALTQDDIGFYITKLEDEWYATSYGSGEFYLAAETLGYRGKPVIPRLIAYLNETEKDFGFEQAAYALFLAAQQENVRVFSGRELPPDYAPTVQVPIPEEVKASVRASWNAWYEKFAEDFEG
ncbi:MAG: S-layer homology domain-containing protein [Candidatus Peregrinibacteria bacterium]|nr:S-layer homology domain-containing protein [Candidatus Peregrinibacteria bacterium]